VTDDDKQFRHAIIVDAMVKARPESAWRRGYDTQYLRRREAILARKPMCAICGKRRATEIDHVQPLIRGGKNGRLRAVCRQCNAKNGGGERRVSKASFGGDRSAAGRYAAEQRWKGHVKRQTRTDANRSTDQKLAEGPTTLLFGRDENGMPVMGSVAELRKRYGDTTAEKHYYFYHKYGLRLDIEGVVEQEPAEESAQLGALQALEELCLSLNNNGNVMEVKLGLIQPKNLRSLTNYQGRFETGTGTVLLDPFSCAQNAEQTVRTIARIQGFESERGQLPSAFAASNAEHVTSMFSAVRAALTNLGPLFVSPKSADEKNAREMISEASQRMGYAVMVHEFGHVVDWKLTGDFTSRQLEFNPEWYNLASPSAYGRQNYLEKAAESFSGWWLFGGDSQGKTAEMFRLVRDRSVKVLAPIFDAKQDVVKSEGLSLVFSELPAEHPVFLFVLAGLLKKTNQKARVRVDAMVDLALDKASFGGDRSAAGRYAAEQRWKGHQKKDDKPTGGRTTDQKLAEGPTTLLFGRDENGMPVMGSVKELKARYGKSAKAREEYFRTRYGVRLKIKPSPAGSVAEAVQMGTLQALEEICLSTVLDGVSMRSVSIGDTGNDPNYEKDANGWYNNGSITVKPESIQKRLGELLSKIHGRQLSGGVGLKTSTKEDEEWYGDESMTTIPQWSTTQMFPSIPAVAQDLKPFFSTDPTKQPPSRKDLYLRMAQRAGYAVMVHEFGHAVDFGGSSRGESVSSDADAAWQGLQAPTEYGRANLYEKAAESFAAWWLFGGGQGNLPKGIAGIGRLAEPILRPILEARGEMVKSVTPPIDIATLPLNHPVVLFTLAPLMVDRLRKAQVKVDAMIQAALVKASFGGDRSAAGRYAAEQRWKGHIRRVTVEMKVDLPQPSGFIGTTKPSPPVGIAVDPEDLPSGYPSHMKGFDLNAMLHEDMEALYRQKDQRGLNTRELLQNISSPMSRRAAKQNLVADLTRGVQKQLDDETLIKAVLGIQPDDEMATKALKQIEKGERLSEEAVYKIVEPFVSHVVHQWAKSSNDNEALSLAIQDVVARVFKLTQAAPASVTGDKIAQSALDYAKKYSNPKSPVGEFLAAVVLQQYANTQAYFAAKGITEVTLHRGKSDLRLGQIVSEANPKQADGKPLGKVLNQIKTATAPVVLRPLSSFSSDYDIANKFARTQSAAALDEKRVASMADAEESQVRVTIRVPVSQVFSTPFTGIGCLPEAEFVVLGQPTTAVIGRPNMAPRND